MIMLLYWYCRVLVRVALTTILVAGTASHARKRQRNRKRSKEINMTAKIVILKDTHVPLEGGGSTSG